MWNAHGRVPPLWKSKKDPGITVNLLSSFMVIHIRLMLLPGLPVKGEDPRNGQGQLYHGSGLWSWDTSVSATTQETRFPVPSELEQAK